MAACGATFSVTSANMGLFLSHSRPTVKNDNPYIESFFKTLKYNPGYPRRFASIDDARIWLADFFNWYITIHRHSGIGVVTPEQRRSGISSQLFEKRNKTFLVAWKKHPERFPKKVPIIWKEQKVVFLNPSDDTKKSDNCDNYIGTKRRSTRAGLRVRNQVKLLLWRVRLTWKP